MGDGSWLVRFPDLIWRRLTPTVHISNGASNLISDLTISHILAKTVNVLFTDSA